MRYAPALVHGLLLTLVLALGPVPAIRAGVLESTNQPAKAEETNVQDIIRAYLQLQEQLHATQLLIEQTRKEAEDASAREAQALAARLEAIEANLSSQRARELEAMQSSNRVMLFMGGTFAVVGFAGMLLMAYFQWRTVHGLASISSGVPPLRALGEVKAVAELGSGDAHPSGQVEQTTGKLLGVLERLEKRIYELEQTSRPALPPAKTDGVATAGGNGNGKGQSAATSPDALKAAGENDRVHHLLEAGQALLDEDNPEAALAKFEEALEATPGNAEALVKKGTALERLQKLEEAIGCYDLAIAADGSLTIAYLHKGGLFNRMEKFGEALECYEKALRTQEKRNP